MSDFDDYNNPQVAALPKHLRQYVVAQNYRRYIPIDQAIWRYVMRQNYHYLKDIAYYPYIPGLHKAGLSIERIPDLQEMNNALAKIGWGAVTVDGFIPPVAFMEYQAYRVLVIAADIRQLKHIEYTPAPDIIHESAGHAPIIADADYHKYLSYFGAIGAKAMFSAQDFDLYEAIRRLSILKEMPDADTAALDEAQQKVDIQQKNMGEPSEMALLSRLHWWSVEYGLIGTIEEPKIYGAGLLSSIGESATCMQPEVKKLCYNAETINYSYDITRQQPQLFVTPSFQNLIDVLDAFADTMAYRRGGGYGLQKAMECKNVCTAVYSSGLQVSGVITSFQTDGKDNVSYMQTTGPTALAVHGKQLKEHGKDYHRDGFGSPVGKLQGTSKALEHYNVVELAQAGIVSGETVSLVFESGIQVTGTVQTLTASANCLQLISFKNCSVKDANEKLLFDPSWGTYDMAVGEKVTSVFCGAADKDAFETVIYKSHTSKPKPVYDNATQHLHRLYQQVRAIRQAKTGLEQLEAIWQQLQTYTDEFWLCALEILELTDQNITYASLAQSIRSYLQHLADTQPAYHKLIADGLHLIEHPVADIATIYSRRPSAN